MQPDRIFACVCKGLNGAIVELRFGLEAHVGLEMDFEAPIDNVCVLSPHRSLADQTGSLFIISTGRQSALLHLSSDASTVVAYDESETDLDLRYRTIAAGMYGTCKIQVTEHSIVVIDDIYM